MSKRRDEEYKAYRERMKNQIDDGIDQGSHTDEIKKKVYDAELENDDYDIDLSISKVTIYESDDFIINFGGFEYDEDLCELKLIFDCENHTEYVSSLWIKNLKYNGRNREKLDLIGRQEHDSDELLYTIGNIEKERSINIIEFELEIIDGYENSSASNHVLIKMGLNDWDYEVSTQKYTVIDNLRTWDISNGTTLELNVVKSGVKPRHYDLRIWEGNLPNNGVTISQDILEELYEAIGKELEYRKLLLTNPNYQKGLKNGYFDGKEMGLKNGFDSGRMTGNFFGVNDWEKDYKREIEIDEKEPESSEDEYGIGYLEGYLKGYKEVYKNAFLQGFNIGYKEGKEEINAQAINKIKIEKENTEEIDFRDFFVYGYSNGCRNPEHTDKELIRATVPLLKRFGDVEKIEFEAIFCRQCGVYYISQSEYLRISEKGRPLCQLMSEGEYEKYKKSLQAPGYGPVTESALHMFGYNVGEKDGYSDNYRKQLLDAAIASGVVTKGEAIGLLKALIIRNEKKYNFRNAVEKWRRDLLYLRGLDSDDGIHTKRLVGVKRIIKSIN